MNAKILVFTLNILFVSCESDITSNIANDTNDVNDVESNLVINAGYICGYGSGQDTLKIWNSTVRYVYYKPGKTPDAIIDTTRQLTEDEWNEIVNSLDMSKFNELNYNSSNISVNGCDEWITVTDYDMTHSIRFNKGLEIEDIKELQNILMKFRSEFN